MAFKITEDCICCGTCEMECPNSAIKEGDSAFVIDPAKCTECVGSHEASKCAEVCPVGAPVLDPAHKETRDALLKKWQKLHPGETPKTK
jgi:ferredoxin